jgi:hypothetical protein
MTNQRNPDLMPGCVPGPHVNILPGAETMPTRRRQTATGDVIVHRGDLGADDACTVLRRDLAPPD